MQILKQIEQMKLKYILSREPATMTFKSKLFYSFLCISMFTKTAYCHVLLTLTQQNIDTNFPVKVTLEQIKSLAEQQ